MKNTLTTACAILWPRRDIPHPASRLDPWEAVLWIIAGWDRGILQQWRSLARLIICRIALLSYEDEEVRAFAIAWALHEAQFWWTAFSVQTPELRHMAHLYKVYTDSGRI